MSLCKITAAHAPVLAALHKTSFPDAWTETAFSTLLALPTTHGWVCEEGFMLCSAVLDEMEVMTLCTVPEKRRQGIAASFLNAATEFARAHAIAHIFLEVAADNLPAQRLYTANGFIQTGKRAHYYKRKEGFVDALCLTKKII